MARSPRAGATRRPVKLIRHADDFVVCFASKAEAERFRAELIERLGEFGLEVEPSKTKILAFGPGADQLAKEAGKGKAETFDFLGFTHYCGRSRNGRRFRMKRRTSRKKFFQKLLAYSNPQKDFVFSLLRKPEP